MLYESKSKSEKNTLDQGHRFPPWGIPKIPWRLSPNSRRHNSSWRHMRHASNRRYSNDRKRIRCDWTGQEWSSSWLSLVTRMKKLSNLLLLRSLRMLSVCLLFIKKKIQNTVKHKKNLFHFSFTLTHSTECVTDLDLQNEMNIFESLLITIKASIIFWGSWGSSAQKTLPP